MKDVSDRHQDFALMSDLYTKESKPQTLSKMVPMRFNPARRSPASLPEPALKWHHKAHVPESRSAGGAPHAEQKARALRLARPPPRWWDQRMERGCGVVEHGWKRHPQHTPAAGASCSGLCSAASLASSSGSSSRPARACPASPPLLGPPHPHWEFAHK